MNKNAKILIISALFILICLCLSMCSGNIASLISGEDGKCDYCGEKAGISHDSKEFCSSCFIKYDGNIWN